MPARILLTLAFTLAALAARADGEILSIITKHDRARLDNYEATRAKAVEQAEETDSKADLARFKEILDRPKLSFQGFDMTGEWRCRTIKAGGPAPLVIYDWFRCRVTDDGAGWMLEKLSGSQRTKGRFFTDSDTRLIYLGSYFVSGDEPPAYGSGPETDQGGLCLPKRQAALAHRIPRAGPRIGARHTGVPPLTRVLLPSRNDALAEALARAYLQRERALSARLRMFSAERR